MRNAALRAEFEVSLPPVLAGEPLVVGAKGVAKGFEEREELAAKISDSFSAGRENAGSRLSVCCAGVYEQASSPQYACACSAPSPGGRAMHRSCLPTLVMLDRAPRHHGHSELAISAASHE